MPDAELGAHIQKRLKDLLAGTDEKAAVDRNLAAQTGALPIYADIGACIAIRPDLEMVAIHTDQDWAQKVEREPGVDPQLRTVALVVGSEKYPELRALLPVRGAGDADCQACAGKGRLLFEAVPRGILCGACSGLGWQPNPES